MRRWVPILLSVAGCTGSSFLPPPSPQGAGACEDPDWPAAEAAAARGEDDVALGLLAGVVRGCPDFAPAHELFQDLAIRQGGAKEDAMRAFYRDAGAVRPAGLEAYLQARLQSNESRRMDLLDTALSLDPGLWRAHLERARVWLRAGNLENAFGDLEAAVRGAPDAPAPNLELAKVLRSLGRASDAARHYARYLAAQPEDLAAVTDYVRLLIYELGEAGPAKPWLDRLMAASPGDPELLMDSAALAWRTNERDRAADLYRQVLELDPQAARAALNLGNLYYRSPDRDEVDKRREWPRARLAYLYFLELAQVHDGHDLRDMLTSVPERLARIDEFLGPLPQGAPPPSARDL